MKTIGSWFNALAPAKRHLAQFLALTVVILGVAGFTLRGVDFNVQMGGSGPAPAGSHRFGATVPFSSVSATGDLSGHFPGPTVAKVNGTAYAAGGSLATGSIPRAIGTASVGYGALDLADTDAVTGSLPAGNQASQSLGGDLSGTTASATVAKVNATTISTAGGALTTGQVLRVTGVSTATWGTLDLANASAVTGALPIANVASGFVKTDGSTTLSSDWALGTHKLTGLSAGTAAGNSVRYEQLTGRQILAFGAQGAPGTTSTRYLGPAMALHTTLTNGAGPRAMAMVTGTLTTIRCRNAGTALATDDVTATALVDDSTTACAVTLTHAVTTVTSATCSTAVTAGQYIGVQVVQTSTEAQAAWLERCSVLIE